MSDERTSPPVRPEVPRPGNKYVWVVAIVLLMAIGVLLAVRTLPNAGEGIEGPRAGGVIPAFAAPAATGDVEGDANICQREPCANQTGPVPACEVRGEGVVNVCELRRQPLVLTFIFDKGADCYPQVDRTERAMTQLPGVSFATVFFTDKKRSEVRELAEARGWTQPVALDRDGTVVALYGVGGCPTTVFARAGGKVADVQLGNLTEEQIRRQVERLR